MLMGRAAAEQPVTSHGKVPARLFVAFREQRLERWLYSSFLENTGAVFQITAPGYTAA